MLIVTQNLSSMARIESQLFDPVTLGLTVTVSFCLNPREVKGAPLQHGCPTVGNVGKDGGMR